MANNKQMTVDAFQNKLKNYYIENGEVSVESRVEILSEAIVKSNKEDNPFLFDMFFSVIKAQDIKLGELVEPNGKIRIEQINEIVMIVQKQSYRNSIPKDVAKDVPKEEIKNNKEIDEKIIINLKNIDYTKPLSADDIKLIAKNRDAWLGIATEEQKDKFFDEITQGQTEDVKRFITEFGKLTKENRQDENVIREFTKTHHKTAESSRLLNPDGTLDIEECNHYVDEVGLLQSNLRAELTRNLEFTKNLEVTFEEFCSQATGDVVRRIQYLIEHNFNVKGAFECIRNQLIFEEEKIDLSPKETSSQIPINDVDQILHNINGAPYESITSAEEGFKDFSVLQKKYDTSKLYSENSQVVFDWITSNAKGYSGAVQNKGNPIGQGDAQSILDISTAQAQFEMYFDQAFAGMPDFYMQAHEAHLEERSALDDAEMARADGVEDLGIANNSGEELTQTSTQTQTLESEESTPTFETKTGFEKLIDKMSGSKNPLAQKLAQRLVAFKNRDKAKLEAANAVRTQKDFTENPSKGRFGAGDSSLMPTGTGLRNSLIGFGEGIMKLFQGKPKEPKPAKVIVPTPISATSWTVADDVKDKIVKAGQEAGKKQDEIVAEVKEQKKAVQGRADDGDARSELE